MTTKMGKNWAKLQMEASGISEMRLFLELCEDVAQPINSKLQNSSQRRDMQFILRADTGAAEKAAANLKPLWNPKKL